MGFERNYQIYNPSNQLNNPSNQLNIKYLILHLLHFAGILYFSILLLFPDIYSLSNILLLYPEEPRRGGPPPEGRTG